MLLPRKTDNFETLKLRFSKSLKDLPLGQFLGSSNSRRYHGILKLLVATLKSEVWKQNCVWLFHYFHFERNYDVLKPKSPYMLLNKNINVNKIETESKMKSPTHWIHFQNNTFCYISKHITSYTCLLVFNFVKNLHCSPKSMNGKLLWMPNKRHPLVNFWIFSNPAPNAYLDPEVCYYSKYFFTHMYWNLNTNIPINKCSNHHMR